MDLKEQIKKLEVELEASKQHYHQVLGALNFAKTLPEEDKKEE